MRATNELQRLPHLEAIQGECSDRNGMPRERQDDGVRQVRGGEVRAGDHGQLWRVRRVH